jgi:hypothetical protein
VVVIAMVDRTLRLTWRKGLLAVTTCASLVFARLVLERLLHVNAPILLLPVALFPLWAVSAALYTFDTIMLTPGHGRRPAR